MKRRVLSLILAAATVLGLCVPALGAEDAEPQAEVSASAVEVEGADGVGALLAAEIAPASVVDGSVANAVTGLTVDSETGTAEVTLENDREAELVVALYDEESGAMLSSGRTEVPACSKSASVTIAGEMQDHFRASAFLLDAITHEPLCDDFSTDAYTAAMEEFLGTDLENIPEERLVDLDGDGDRSTNVMVFDSGVLLAGADSGTNVVTDNGDGTYTITHADESFRALSRGGTFSYTGADGTVLPVKAADVRVDGDTVTVTADQNTSLEDFFDYVKIEVGYGPDSGAAPASAGVDVTKTVELNVQNGPLSVGGSMSVTTKFKLYYSGSMRSTELVTQLEGEITASVTGELDRTVDLPSVRMGPFFGVVIIGLTPQVIVEASCSVTASGTFSGTVGEAWSSGAGGSSRSTPMEFKPEVKVEGEFFIGVGLKLSASLINDRLAGVSLTGRTGVDITAELTGAESGEDGVRHECLRCIAGEIDAVVGLLLEVNIGDWETEAALPEYKVKLTDFYYSITYNEFGWQTCPYRYCRVRITALDGSGRPVYDVRIGVIMTNGSHQQWDRPGPGGVAEFYLPSGVYTVTATDVQFGMTSGDMRLIVKDEPLDVEMSFDPAAPLPTEPPWPVTPDDGPFDQAGYLRKDSFGNDVYWQQNGSVVVLFVNNTLQQYTTGSRNSSIVTTVVMADNMQEAMCVGNESVIDFGKTWRVADDGFANHEKLEQVAFPDTMREIGSYAFWLCMNLREVDFGSGVQTIGKYAFDNDAMTTLTIPNNVLFIGERAFSNCVDLQEVTMGARTTDKNAFGWCLGLKKVTLTDDVQALGQGAFWCCHELTSLRLSENPAFTRIAPMAFRECTYLPEVTIPDNVKEIGWEAFYGCHTLSSIVLPASVEKVEGGAFANCASLESVTILNPEIQLASPFIDSGKVCSVKDVYYNGTEEQWAANPTLASSFMSINVTVHYESTGPGTGYVPVPASAAAEPVTTAEPEASAEPEVTAEPVPEATAEPKATTEPLPEGTAEPTPEPTAEPTPEPTPEPVPEPTAEPLPEPEGIGPTDATQEPAGEIVPAAAFAGTTDQQHALFTGLRAGADYLVAVVKDPDAETLFAAENLLFIAQAAADSQGRIALAYAPSSGEAAAVRAYGPEQTDLGDADGDGSVTLRDVTLLYQTWKKQPTAYAVDLDRGDVTGNGCIDGEDAKAAFRFVTGQSALLG